MKTQIFSLFSGSSGNCTLVRHGGTDLLIDAGVSCRAICSSLRAVGSAPENISAIFVTHEHIDHVRGLDVFCKNRKIPVHITRPSAENLPYAAGTALCDCFVMHNILFSENVGDDISIHSFAVSHDSVCSVGYRLDFADTGESFALATDTGYVTDGMCSAMCGADYCVLEANYDESMLMCGPYPYPLKRRILSSSGHLSNIDSADFAAELEASGTKGIMLAHLSRENNYPPLAERTVAAKLCGEARLTVAAPSEPVLLAEF